MRAGKGLSGAARKGHIAVLATLDTKGGEVACMKALLEARGYGAMVIDVGALGPPCPPPGISNREVARAAGWDLSELVGTGQRDLVMDAMGKGAGKVLLRLHGAKRIHGGHRPRRQPGLRHRLDGHDGPALRIPQVSRLHGRLREHQAVRGVQGYRRGLFRG